jgi:hypothetical protein
MGSTLLLRALRLLRHREATAVPALPENQAPARRRRSHEVIVDLTPAKLPEHVPLAEPVEGHGEGQREEQIKDQVDPASP